MRVVLVIVCLGIPKRYCNHVFYSVGVSILLLYNAFQIESGTAIASIESIKDSTSSFFNLPLLALAPHVFFIFHLEKLEIQVNKY
jgi:hypothetical protein